MTAAYLAAKSGMPRWKRQLPQWAQWAFAGEIALERLQKGEGNSTYRNRLIDAIDCLDAETLERGANYEVR